MPPVGFEPTISAGERPQTYALDRTATGTGLYTNIYIYIHIYREREREREREKEEKILLLSIFYVISCYFHLTHCPIRDKNFIHRGFSRLLVQFNCIYHYFLRPCLSCYLAHQCSL